MTQGTKKKWIRGQKDIGDQGWPFLLRPSRFCPNASPMAMDMNRWTAGLLAATLLVLAAGRQSHAQLAAGLDHLWHAESGLRSRRASSVVSIPPGATSVLADIKGPCVIRRMWFTAQSSIPQAYGMMILRITWDGETSPSVEVPLGDFMGVGFGKERELKSAMTEMFPAGGENRAAVVSYWPMPFRKRAHITIQNESQRVVSMFFTHIDYEQQSTLPADTLYFHAQWRRENPVRLHEPYTILEARGRGCYVGTLMNYHLLSPGAWVEGGDDFYLDGATTPTLPGTGAEDYFGQAWGFRHEDNAAFHGTSLGPDDNHMTAYCWHVPDPIWFQKSLKAVMKCHGWDVGDRQDDYSSVAYWYQTEPHRPFPLLPPPDYDYLGVAPEYRIPTSERFSAEHLPPPPPGRNLAREAASWRESGHYSDESPGNHAIDGRLDTKWCDGPSSSPTWLALDLGAEKKLHGFVVKNASSGGESEGFDTNAFRVETAPSLEGPWTTAAEIDNVKSPPNKEFRRAIDSVVFPAPIPARCIRLIVTNPGNLDAITRIQEFEVYGD